ncbi:MAG TPA: mechanosensitive ion channel domain-containing protein, partial [Chroococcales cyanobacterium]
DEIKTGAFEGKVEEIDIRSTHIRMPSGEIVIVPNGSIYTDPVVVNTSAGRRRVKMTIVLDAKHNAEQDRDMILKIVQGTEGVLASPPPQVYLTSVDPANLSVDLYFWSEPQQEKMQATTDRVARAIRSKLRGAEPVAAKQNAA